MYVGYLLVILGICLNFNCVFFEWCNGFEGFLVILDVCSEWVWFLVKLVKLVLDLWVVLIYEYCKCGGIEEWFVLCFVFGGNGGWWLFVC